MATGGDLTVQNIGPVAPVKNHCHVKAKPDTFPAEENGKTVNPTTPTVDPGEERRRFAEFGLGRGVDITDPSPFMNKKSFQFYKIDSEDMIIRTDEGKARRCIFQKFETSNASSIQLSASVTLPHTPIEIGAAVDYSRNIMQSGYTIGWKTIIRSIEFRKGQEPENSFEKWVKARLPIALYDKENDDDLIVDLIKLIIEFGITHYVSKIVLGSAEYRAMSERHYSTFAKGKIHLGVEKIVDTLLTASKKQMSSFEVTEIKWIGQVDEHGEVTRQGVVDAKLESIVNLISPDYKEGRLRNALSKALDIYVTIRTSYIPARLAKEDKVVKRAIEEFRRLEPFGYASRYNEIKLLLLGADGVGKTSLVLRFVTGGFNSDQPSTIGCETYKKTASVDTVPVKFFLIDTGGQERFHSIGSQFCRKVQAAIVVYDITRMETFNTAMSWVEELQREASPNIVVALLGNMADLTDRREVEYEEAQVYAEENSLLFLESSAKTVMTAAEIFLAVARKVCKTIQEAADKDGLTALMKASAEGDVEHVKVLLDSNAQVNDQDKYGETPLMKASEAGNVECVKVLLDRGAEVNMQDERGWTALMKASQWGHTECVKRLLDRDAQVNMKTKFGDTALHLAIRTKMVDEKDQFSCVRTLLFHPGIDVNLKNNEGRTAMKDVGYERLRVLNQVLKTCSDFPADSYGKVVLCGNTGAGKSTLTQAIINLSKPRTIRYANRFFRRKDEVESLTTGIIPHQVESPKGNMIIYDLAGHHQFFSSHSGYLEAISLNSPAIFLLLQDVRKDYETMVKEVRYWSTMIDNVCHKKSSVIIVGTHADQLESKQQIKQKQSDLDTVFKMAASHQTLVTVTTLNLKNIYSEAMDQFQDLLYSTNRDVLRMSPPISLMCHMMLAFLKERLPPDMHAILLSDLLKIMHEETDQDKFINLDITAVIPLLETLSERGLIIFIPSKDPNSSWVVCKTESIIKEVNGALFADELLKKSTGLASKTGLISKEVVKNAFPHYNCDMITQFMVHFEIGQEVDLSQIKTIMVPDGSTSSDLPLLFIPALVGNRQRSTATDPNNGSLFCWSETVKDTSQFFTSRFHHVLLHRLPLEFALPEAQTTSPHSQPLNHLCDVWSRGIKWLSETGVTTVVEMSESFQAISLTMSSPNKTSPKYLELAHSVRKVIKKARQDFCQHLEVLEVVSCPPECSSDHSTDTHVELSRLRKAILDKETHVVDLNGKKSVAIDEWKKMEPYLSYLVAEASTFPGQVLPPVEGDGHVSGRPCPTAGKQNGSLANDAALNTKCEMEVIWKIVKLGFDWILVGNRLLTPQSVTDISRDESDEANRRDKMLITWLQRDGAKATYARLVEVLKDVGCTDTAEKGIELVTGKGVQPSPVQQLQKSGESQQPPCYSNWSQPSHGE